MSQKIGLTLFFSLFLLWLHAQNSFSFNKTEVISRLIYDVSVLANDSMEGRETGTKGEKKAASFIISQFERAGLTPLDKGGSYCQVFSGGMPFANLYSTKNKLIINGNKYRNLIDFFPLTYSSNDSITAEIINVNFGLEIPALNYNDYADLKNVSGKIFVMKMSIPGGYKKDSPYFKYKSLQKRIELAINKGAKGIIMVNDDKHFPDINAIGYTSLKENPLPVVYCKREIHAEGIATIVTYIERFSAVDALNVMAGIDNHAAYSIVIGAHYDHVGKADSTSVNEFPGQVYNGADDNASGTASMMEIARWLKAHPELNHYNYIFVAFSAEESGLLGSAYFVKSGIIDKSKINAMINLDMVGRLNKKNKLLIFGTGTSDWKNILRTASAGTDLKLVKIASPFAGSDHMSFTKEKVPALFFNTCKHDDYHKPTDDVEKINFEGQYMVTQLVQNILVEMNNRGKMSFEKTGFFALLASLMHQ